MFRGCYICVESCEFTYTIFVCRDNVDDIYFRSNFILSKCLASLEGNCSNDENIILYIKHIEETRREGKSIISPVEPNTVGVLLR